MEYLFLRVKHLIVALEKQFVVILVEALGYLLPQLDETRRYIIEFILVGLNPSAVAGVMM